MLNYKRLAAYCLVPAIGFAALASAAERPVTRLPEPESLRLADVFLHLQVLARQPALPSLPDLEETFDLLLDGRPYPGTCATPLLIGLEQGREAIPESVRHLHDRLGPDEPGRAGGTASAPARLPGSFRLHYHVGEGVPGAIDPEDGDLDGTPDEAQMLLDRLDEAKRAAILLLDRSGMPLPWPEATEPVHDVVITDLPQRIEGYVWSRGERSAILLDREAVLGPGGESLLKHQITHLYQAALTADEPPWWYEAHAVWAEDPSGSGAGLRSAAVAAYLADSRSGIGSTRIAAWEGSFLWPHYLAGGGEGERVLGAAWDEMAAVPGENLLEGFDAALNRLRGTSLTDEVRAFRIWNVFLGEMDDGNHYPFASVLPSALGAEVRTYPIAWHGRGALAPLGGEMIHLAAHPAPGGWLLEFQAEPSADWDLSLITVPARRGAGPRLAEIPTEDGHGSAGVPWRDLSAIIAVVQNLGGERAEPSRFTLSARQDPLVPFDLMSFAPLEEESAVALRWHTEREIDLIGWRVYRSRDPISGFTPVNTFLIPAAGGPGMASYTFLDSNVVAGRKYYYVLEGITRHGFTEITHPVSVRIHGPAGR